MAGCFCENTSPSGQPQNSHSFVVCLLACLFVCLLLENLFKMVIEEQGPWLYSSGAHRHHFLVIWQE